MSRKKRDMTITNETIPVREVIKIVAIESNDSIVKKNIVFIFLVLR